MTGMTRAFDASTTALAARELASPSRWADPAPRLAVERDLARRTGWTHAVTFATGREALVALLRSLELPPGAGIVAPAFTCPAVLNAMTHCGLRMVPAEIEPRTLGLAAGRLPDVLTPGIRAILMHHLFSRVARDGVRVARIARDRGLALIEDCAHLPLRRARPGTPGRLGLAALHSFESTKPVPSVCGGAVLTDDASLGRRLYQLQGRWPEPDHAWTAGVLAAVFTWRAAAEDPRRWMTPRFERLVRGTRPPPIGRQIPDTCRRMPAPVARLLHHQLRRGPALWTLYRRQAFKTQPFGPAPDSLREALQPFPVARRTWGGLGRAWTRESVRTRRVRSGR